MLKGRVCCRVHKITGSYGHVLQEGVETQTPGHWAHPTSLVLMLVRGQGPPSFKWRSAQQQTAWLQGGWRRLMRRLTSVSRGPMYETTSRHLASQHKLQLREPDSASQADRDTMTRLTQR